MQALFTVDLTDAAPRGCCGRGVHSPDRIEA